MYQVTSKKLRADAICKRMRDGKKRKQLQRVKDLGARVEHDLPALRKIVIVINFDFGFNIDIFRFKKTNRIDSYLVSNNGLNPEKMGWSVFCKRLSNHYPRLLSPLNFN